MSLDRRLIMRAISPKLATKAIQTFDKATILVVSVCWAAALVMTSFAIYTIIASSSARRAAESAQVMEPILPKINRAAIEPRAAQQLLDRLKHRYPEVTFSTTNDQQLKVSSADGSKFREWLTAVTYVDIMSPDFHWTVQDFCVGKCKGDIMSATLKAEKISFAAPEIK